MDSRERDFEWFREDPCVGTEAPAEPALRAPGTAFLCEGLLVDPGAVT